MILVWPAKVGHTARQVKLVCDAEKGYARCKKHAGSVVVRMVCKLPLSGTETRLPARFGTTQRERSV